MNIFSSNNFYIIFGPLVSSFLFVKKHYSLGGYTNYRFIDSDAARSILRNKKQHKNEKLKNPPVPVVISALSPSPLRSCMSFVVTLYTMLSMFNSIVITEKRKTRAPPRQQHCGLAQNSGGAFTWYRSRIRSRTRRGRTWQGKITKVPNTKDNIIIAYVWSQWTAVGYSDVVAGRSRQPGVCIIIGTKRTKRILLSLCVYNNMIYVYTVRTWRRRFCTHIIIRLHFRIVSTRANGTSWYLS